MKASQPKMLQWVKQLGREYVADSELLSRFLTQQDQVAFELLVHRYGSMVLGLCRRLLGQLADAEDAFQATFLTLAHQAKSIRKQQSLGSWLYKVAWRMCQRQRRCRSLRLFATAEPVHPSSSTSDTAEHSELAEVLVREVDRLSESLKAVVVLCCLRGLSPREAALELHIPSNTVAVRLRRARELLKKRLESRGYVLSAGIAAVLGISSHASPVGILATPISQHALQISSQGLVAGMLSPSVACLLKGAILAMWLKPVQLMTVVALTLSLIAIPSWNGSGPVQAQGTVVSQKEGLTSLYLNRTAYVNRWAGYSPAHTQPTYSQDENLPEEAKKWIAEQQKQEDIIRQEAELRMRGSRVELHAKLKQLQDTFTKAGNLDGAIALREQVRRLELAIASAYSYESHSGLIQQSRGQNGKTLVFQVRGYIGGSVWGDGVYTDDSHLAAVAVHAGLLKPGQTGLIKVTIMPGRDSYAASTQHGVTSQVYQIYPGSMKVEKADVDSLIK